MLNRLARRLVVDAVRPDASWLGKFPDTLEGFCDGVEGAKAALPPLLVDPPAAATASADILFSAANASFACFLVSTTEFLPIFCTCEDDFCPGQS